MKKLFLACMLLCLAISFVVVVPKAKAAQLTDFACNSGSLHCIADGRWHDTNHGSSVILPVISAGLIGDDEWWTRDISVEDSVGNSIHFGIDREGFHTAFCLSLCGVCHDQAGQELYYFYETNFGSTQTHRCDIVPTADIGQSTFMQIGYYTSNGGGMFVKLSSRDSTAMCQNGCFFSGAQQTWGYTRLTEELMAFFQSGNIVARKGDWVSSKWQNLSGTWITRTNNFYDAFNYRPPSMFWVTPPSTTHPGGDLRSCTEGRTDNNCT